MDRIKKAGRPRSQVRRPRPGMDPAAGRTAAPPPSQADDPLRRRHAVWRAATILKTAYHARALEQARLLESLSGATFGREVTRWLEHEQRRLAALRAFAVLDTAPDPAFEELAFDAASACAAPIASVNLIDEFREWRMVAVNLPLGDNALPRSACARFIDESELVVIADLMEENVTREVQPEDAEPALRFYASAPIVTAEGFIVGRLCVVDHVARPQGLLPEQAGSLRGLAWQAASLLERRRAPGLALPSRT